MYAGLKDGESLLGRVDSVNGGVEVPPYSTYLMIFIASVTLNGTASLITAHNCIAAA